ncbi:alcohol dehydrogenase catalytic domain-containing protein [Pseudonocardia acaciae]|uniref:alcohol dehydrogenase catalytic domain-containing protein n=1 Tax=Pseudonocardia acaciae TaxID=551276 RepID=UPI00068660C1|nr:alcohol dehydrogenase catalytic domain-containing protein [Pseudonocardia acaciae]
MTASGWRRTVASVFEGVDTGLRIQDVDVSAPGPDEVLLTVAACGACHSDVHKLEGHGTVAPPCVLGHELSGTLAEVGASVTGLRPGDRVACSFMVPCGGCAACTAGAQDDCGPFRSAMQRDGLRFDGSYRYQLPDGTGLRASGVGGLSRQVVLPATAVFALPDGWPRRWPLADVAVLGCAGLTAYGAVHRAARGTEGERVVVLGAGGVGLCVVALAAHDKASGVVAVDLRADALGAARDFGAVAALDGTAPDLADSVRDALGGDPDVVFDTVGTPGSLSQAQRLLAVGGRVVVTGLGGTGGPGLIEGLPAFVRRKLSIIGSYAGRPDEDMPRLLAAVRAGALDPSRLISARYPFEDAAQAYADVAAGKIVGRALIEF